MAEDIEDLKDEISSNFTKSLYASDHFRDRILGLTSLYPVDVFEKTYKKLGVVFDSYYYESKTYLVGKKIVNKGL